MIKPAYTYSATVLRVIDGDTIECMVDIGFNTFIKEKFRLFGIDTPEKTSKIEEIKNLAIAASSFLTTLVIGKIVVIESMTKDKYGRWLAKIHLQDEVKTINEKLIEHGFAKEYFGDSKSGLWEPTK